MCPSVILAESVILSIMLNQNIMNSSYGGNKSGACFKEVKWKPANIFSYATFFGRGGGSKFSWILGFVVIRGKKSVVGSGLNHTPHTRVEQSPLVLK